MVDPPPRNAPGAPELTDAYVDHLRQYDEQLRIGETPIAPSAGTPREGPRTIDAYVECLHALERIWPRSGPPSMSAAIPDRLGRFRIERIVGQGGFGIVYLAHDPHLGRHVALKVPRLHALMAPGMVERFQREARAAAVLDHPQIVPVYEAGEANGLCYIVSAYCPGPTLATWIRAECPVGTTARQAAGIVRLLADAVAYSHARGILHRDIKPGNVMLFPMRNGDSTPEQLPNGLPFNPRICDFGLAKILQNAMQESNSQDETDGNGILGTPGYMAPEQFDRTRIGPGADVYALGAVLYELLVGRPPFQGPNVVDVLEQVRSNDPLSVRQLRRDVTRDLETICLKCLEKSPARRYPTADALRDDPQRFLDGRPIKARPPGPAGSAIKAVRRHPAIAVLLATATAFAIGMAVSEARHAARLETKNAELQAVLHQVQDEKSRAIASEHEARGIAYALNINAAWRAREAGDFIEFSKIVDRYRDGTELAQYRGVEWHYLERMTRTSKRTWLELETPTYDIISGPTGQVALVGEDAVVRLMDEQSGKLIDSWPTGQIEVNSACFMPDGRSMWTAGDDGTLREWDLATHQELRRIDAHPDAKAFKVEYLPQQNQLISCGTEGPIRLWDLQTGTPAGTLEGHTAWIQDVALLPDGQRVVSASDDDTLRTWDLDSRQQVWLDGNGAWKFRDLAISPDGQYLAACRQHLLIYDAESLAVLLGVEFIDEARLACFGGDSRRVYVADRLGIIHAFRLEQDDSNRIVPTKPFAQWRAHSSGVYALRLSAGCQSILTAGRDGIVAEWNEPGEAARPMTISDPGAVLSFAFDPTGRWLVVGSESRLAIHDLKESEAPATILADSGEWWTAVDVDSSGTTIAAGNDAGEVSLWSLEGARLLTIADQTAHSDDASRMRKINSLCFSHDGRALAVANRGLQEIDVFDARTGTRLTRVDVGSVRAVRLSPTEDLLAAPTADHRIGLWNWPSGTSLWRSERFPERPVWIEFFPDGQTILADTGDRTVRVLDCWSGEIVREMRQHRAGIQCMAISPDGRTIVTKDSEGSHNLWHTNSGQLLFSLPAERDGGFRSVSFSPDGAWLAYLARPNQVHLLPMHP